jgi:mannan endo-1,4-beta-mannosidase
MKPHGSFKNAYFKHLLTTLVLAISLLLPFTSQLSSPAAAAGKPPTATSTLPGSPTATPSSGGARDLLIPNGTWHGVFLDPNRTLTSAQVTTFESEAGKKVGAFLYYLGWYENAWGDVQRQLDVLDPMGIKLHLTWEPKLKNGGNPLDAILNGSQDTIILDLANKSKAWGKPFFLRFAHEMNGNWYPWGGQPDKYKQAWIYVWNKFQSVGATNAIWVWSPNADSVPDEPWNAIANYYPGTSYVDWVGVDFYGLMWGNENPGLQMDKVQAWNNKPVMISETAAADCAHYAVGTTIGKDEWINRFYADMGARTWVKAFFWFNVNKEADWRITSCPSPAAQNAYRAGVASSRYVTRP